ncbi:MAG TPA: Ku protein [Noviherbaspirillum sp.]|nr:Ku protein [Noviherbaspirillum sp.]
MARTLWKGAISFGLLHAPIALYTAARSEAVDFDWLHRETLQPIGYKRVIKETGEEVDKEDIVKGVKYGDQYVILSDEEIKSANVESTHTIDIVGFTRAEDVNFLFFEKPYYLAPTKGGEKVYVLLREALLKTGRVGVALVVLHNKQHLAALIATPHAMVLNTLRWASEVSDASELNIPAEGMKAAKIKPKEVEMATQLIESMCDRWDPEQYRDTFRDDIMALVKQKADAGLAQTITEVKAEEPKEEAEEVDLTELLRRSLQGNGKAARTSARKDDGKKAPPPAARKSAGRTRTSKAAH